ncbi:histidine kinase dimerization/phosphoacceptor domain -containing protein [Maribacter sp. 2307ULW6-5]|uniref:tetratricopeptide repeat-containing sensor histidine kinase n=1 Tax=Maribacter sp. 2307ULW6-5 TaxID=3386275 RepID=UPI0039BD0E34
MKTDEILAPRRFTASKNKLKVYLSARLGILLLLLLPPLSPAQQESLQLSDLQSIPIDSAIVGLGKAINKMTGENDTAIKKELWKILGRAKENKEPLLLAKVYKELANWHYLSISSENKDSIYFYDNKALQEFLKTKDKELISKAYRTVGFDLDFMQRYAEAEVHYFKGLEMAQANKDQKTINAIHASLSNLYANTKDYTSALKYSKMVVAAYEKEQNTHPLIRAFLGQSHIYLNTDMPNEALNAVNKAMALVPNLPEEYQKSEILNVRAWRAQAYRDLRRYDEALADFEFSWKGMREKYGDEMANGWKGGIGSILYLQGKYAEAIPYLKDYVAHFREKKVHSPEELKKHYLWLAESYKALDRPDLAYTYLAEGKDIAINALNEETQALKSELRVKYETEQKDETISSQSELIAQQQKNQLLSYLAGALLVVILGGLFYAFNKNKKKNKQLENLNKNLAVSNAQLDKRHKENELLLKEIHHRVKNNLELVSSLLQLQSAQIEDPSVQAAMRSSQNRVHSMGIIHQKLYQNEHLTSIEMRDYFVNLGDNIRNSFDAHGKIKIDCDMPELVLDVDTAISVGLITNELMTNAFKYAFKGKEKGNIQVNLTRQGPNNDNFVLYFSDDGIGKAIDAPLQGTGFGTQLIDLLTKQLNGTISYQVENGTKVSLVFGKPAIS